MEKIIKKRAVSQINKERAISKQGFMQRLDAILPILPRNAATVICQVYKKTDKEKQIIHNVISGRTQNEGVLKELESFAKDYTHFLAEQEKKAQENLQTV